MNFAAPWLLIDASFLAYRAYHAFTSAGLSENATIYGFLQSVTVLREQRGINQFAFCFDYGKPKRAKMHSFYKQARRSDDTKRDTRQSVSAALESLFSEILPEIGFVNCFRFKGYEADDLIASIAQVHAHTSFEIVSADSDLYQLLSPRVTIWNPIKKQLLSDTWLRKTYGTNPTTWIDVKAIAGDSSDGIPGITGIGIKTAARFLSGSLSHTSKAFNQIIEYPEIWERNRKLIALPIKGTPRIQLVANQFDPRKFTTVVRKLGMPSLV